MSFHYSEYFQNPEVLPIAAAVLVFVMAFEVLKRPFKENKGVAILIAIALALLAAYYLFDESRYIEYIWTLPWIFGLLVLGVVIKILIPFFKFGRKQF